ncbi:MAG: zinc ribbon domain-containing protein [Clostridiales bacterium]|nr:zinc ribbon domain-containing protein [Clostridiales bacterium]
MFCVGCGNKIESSYKFCEICGTKNRSYVKDAVDPPYVEHQPEVSVDTPIQQADTPEINIHQEIPVEVAEPQFGASIESQINTEVAASQETTANEMTMLNKLDEVSNEQVTDKHVKKIGIGVKIASVCLSILALIVTLLFLSTLFVKTSLSTKVMKKAFQKIDYINIELDNILVDGWSYIYEGDTAADIIYNVLYDRTFLGLSKNEVEEILEKATFSDYLSDKLSQYAKYAISGSRTNEISAREIVRLVEDNKDVFEDVAGIEISSSDLKGLERYLKEEEILESISLDNIDTIIEENNIEWVHKLFANTTLMIAVIVSGIFLLGLIIWISYLHRSIKAPLSYIGIPILIVGFLFTLVMLAGYIIKASLFGEIEDIYTLIKPILSGVFIRGIIFGATTSVVGLIMVIAYKRIRKSEKCKKTIINPIN